MSLLNDMLKDVQARPGKQDSSSDINAGSEQDFSSTKTEKSNSKKKLSPSSFVLPGVAAAAVLYFLIVELNIFGLMPSDATPQNAAPQPAAFNSKWLAEAEKIKAAKLDREQGVSNAQLEKASSAPVAETNSKAKANDQEQFTGKTALAIQTAATAEQNTRANGSTQNSAQNLTLKPLLDLGYLALREGRLLNPAQNNAYSLFSNVLLLDPNNVSALAGIRDLEQHLGDLIRAKVQAQQWDQANQLLGQMQKAELSEGLIADAQQEIRLAKNIAAKQNTQAKFGGAKPSDNKAAPALVSTRDASQDESWAKKVKRSPSAKVAGQALAWLQSHPQQAEKTALALADYYAQQNQLQKLEQLHGALEPSNLPYAAYAQARKQMLLKDFNGVLLALIDKKLPQDDVMRLRLLGAAQQGAGQYLQAAESYHQVLSLEANNPNDWLGLAVAYDQNRQFNQAYQAYRRVLQLQHPDPRVMAFVRERSADLSITLNSRG